MRRFPWGTVLTVVILAVVVGGGLGWWVTRTETAEPVKAAASPQETAQATQTAQPIPSVAKVSNAIPAAPEAVEKTEETQVAETATPTQWQDALDNVLTSDGEAEDKADRLLRMLPHLNEEGQVEVSQHLVNFVNDEKYMPIAQILTNATTADAVDTVLMTDLLNRNDGIKLPLLLTMAEDQSHPKHDEAKELLELYLQENHGTNWNEWQSSVTNYLTQNGGEPIISTSHEPVTIANP